MKGHAGVLVAVLLLRLGFNIVYVGVQAEALPLLEVSHWASVKDGEEALTAHS